MTLAVDGYVHLFWANAAPEYREHLNQLKRSQYTSLIKESLNRQIKSFKNTRAKKTLYGSNTDIKQFLKETNYGKSIATAWNEVLQGTFHGFTSTVQAYNEGSDKISFSLGMNTKPEELEKIIQQILDKGKNPLHAGASVLTEISEKVDELQQNLGSFILDSLQEENADIALQQEAIKNIGNNSVITLSPTVSQKSQEAIKDWNIMVQKNQQLKDYATQLSSYGNDTSAVGTGVVGKTWDGIARFLNSFGGFIGEVAAYVGLYAAITDPKLKGELSTIEELWHTGAQKNLNNFISTSVNIQNDPEFKEFLMKSASLADNETIKDDINLIINNNLVKGSIGVNIKQGGMLNLTGATRQNHYLTLDTSYSFAQMIQNAISQNRALPQTFGDKYFYYNVAEALPNGKIKGQVKSGLSNQITNLLNNYKEIIVNANIMLALMGRLKDAQVSAGNNSLLFLVNNKVYTVLEVMQSLVKAIDSKDIASTGHFLKAVADTLLQKKKAEEINSSNFIGTTLNQKEGVERSQKIEPLLETFFNQKVNIKMNLALLNLIN